MAARKPAPPPPKGFVSRQDAAGTLGLSVRQFERRIQPKLDASDVINEEMYPRRMFVSLAAAAKIYAEPAADADDAPASGPDKERYDKARADREEANAEKARLEVARLKGELLDAGLVEAGLRAFASVFRNSGQLLQARFGSAVHEHWTGTLAEAEREIERLLAEAVKGPEQPQTQQDKPPKNGKPKRGPGRPRKAKAQA